MAPTLSDTQGERDVPMAFYMASEKGGTEGWKFLEARDFDPTFCNSVTQFEVTKDLVDLFS